MDEITKEVTMFSRKVLLTILAGLLLILPAGLGGCAKEVSAQEITDNVLLAYPKIDTFKLNMNLTMAMAIESGTEQMEMNVTGTAAGQINSADNEMQIAINMAADLSGQGSQNISEEIYVVGGQSYMKMSILGFDQWFKMDIPEEIWNQQNQLEQQVEFLRNAIEVTKLGEETVDGVNCYILQITPDLDAMLDWVKAQQQDVSPDMDLSNINLNEIFKNLSLKMWVAKDSYLPVKGDIQITMEILPQDVGADASETGKISMDMSAQVKYYDYGKPVTIELPQEALNAPSLPSS